MMNLQPHNTAYLGACWSCGCSDRFLTFPVAYCEDDCRPDRRAGFLRVSVLGDPPQPHVHVTCPRCRYTWLMATRDAYTCLAWRA